MSLPFFSEIISRHGVQPDPYKWHAATDMLSPAKEKELQSFLGIMNNLGKFSPSNTEVCDSLRKLT